MAPAAKPVPEEEELSAAEPTNEPEKPKADFLGLIIFALVCINLLTVGAMGYFLNNLWTKFQALQHETEQLKVASAAQETTTGVTEALKPTEIGILYPIESFLVNVASEQGPKFLQAQLEIELLDPALEDEIARKKPAIRDSIIVLLSSRSYRQLRDPSGMEKLRGDIKRAINNLLRTGKIKSVYFTQFHFN